MKTKVDYCRRRPWNPNDTFFFLDAKVVMYFLTYTKTVWHCASQYFKHEVCERRRAINKAVKLYGTTDLYGKPLEKFNSIYKEQENANGSRT